MAQNGKRRGAGQRCTDALDNSSCDEHCRVARNATDQRGEREHDEAMRGMRRRLRASPRSPAVISETASAPPHPATAHSIEPLPASS